MIDCMSIRRWAIACVAVLVASSVAADDAPKGVTHTLPASDRTYEVLIPSIPAAEMKDLPLLVYLHGSGTPDLDRAKRDYWPLLAKRKCLMVLPRSRGEKMWLSGEEKFIIDVIAHAQTEYRVDAKRILLMGVSGGGQVALFLADRLPEKFRAIVVISTSPVAIRGRRHEWFYPNRKVLKTCPYFVINPITQGSSLMYWRQVQSKLAPAGASISVLPVTGKAEHYQPPPEPLGKWLDEVLTGKHPAALPDPQRAAVTKMFAPVVDALPKALAAAKAAPVATMTGGGKIFDLTISSPTAFERVRKVARTDSTRAPLTQIRAEHRKWPITIRADARATKDPLAEVLDAEQAATDARGMLAQTYHTGKLVAGPRTWRYTIGSITYPDRLRGWVSALYVHAAAPIAGDGKQWLSVTVTDETQEPDAKELAEVVKTAVSGITAKAAMKR